MVYANGSWSGDVHMGTGGSLQQTVKPTLVKMVSMLHSALPACSRHLTAVAGHFQSRILVIWGKDEKLEKPIFAPVSHPEVRIDV